MRWRRSQVALFHHNPRSSKRFEKPHSLSYQASTLTKRQPLPGKPEHRPKCQLLTLRFGGWCRTPGRSIFACGDINGTGDDCLEISDIVTCPDDAVAIGHAKVK